MKGKNFSLNSNKRHKNDYYQTPYGMTRQLLEVENFEGKILEPSCGAGAIVKVLRDFKKSVDYCDLNNEFSLTGIFKNFKDFINDDFDKQIVTLMTLNDVCKSNKIIDFDVRNWGVYK